MTWFKINTKKNYVRDATRASEHGRKDRSSGHFTHTLGKTVARARLRRAPKTGSRAHALSPPTAYTAQRKRHPCPLPSRRLEPFSHARARIHEPSARPSHFCIGVRSLV